LKEIRETALVIGGGPAGMEAALRIGQAGCRVVIAEKQAGLGGLPRGFQSSFPKWEDPAVIMDRKIAMMRSCPRIEIRTATEVISGRRTERGFTFELSANGKTESLEAAAVVLATGFDLFDCSVYGEYGYGIYPGVVTSLEFESRLKAWAAGEKEAPEAVVFIQCVGSRDRSKGRPYCSKICCMYTARQAGLFKALHPGARCYVFYIDIRAAGKNYEEYVRSVIEEKKVRYIRGRPGKVLPGGKGLLVRAEDTLMGVPVEVETDMVVLAPAVVPGRETRALAEALHLPADPYGFPEPPAGSPAGVADGVFIAGGCGFAVNIDEAIRQGAAAAAEVIAYLTKS
jgi:heterodisulfide reductase subunit A